MSKRVKLFILFFSLFSLFLVANISLAADFGFEPIASSIGLTDTDPRILVGRLIQVLLSFLGVIALVLIMYAGFLWMTSGGEEDKVVKAKQILKNTVIGLVIILSSWAITTFILSRLSAALQVGGNDFTNNGSGNINPGLGAMGACTVDSYYPSNNQTNVPRNTSIMITFKEEIKLDTVCVNAQGTACTCDSGACNRLNPESVRIFKTELGDACVSNSCNGNTTDVSVTVPAGNKTLVLTPLSYLGSQNANTDYSVQFTNDVKKLDGSSMFRTCSADYASWKFNVSTQLDLVPPIVSPGGIFPIPDNEKDIFRELIPARAASGKISVNSCPQIYTSAKVTGVNPPTIEVGLNYHGDLTGFKISVPADAPGKAQLFDNNNNLLGIADFDSSGYIYFTDYLSFTAANHPAGSLWNITISPEKLADSLTVGSVVYSFADNNGNNNIKVPAVCDKNIQASNIEAKLSGHPDIQVSRLNEVVTLSAKVAGENGNNLLLEASNNSALVLSPFVGGVDMQERSVPLDKKDSPMNSVIQINFNEAINPMTVSGSADEVANYIKVVNFSSSSSMAGAACSADVNCRSYKCENNVCVGNYLGGKFMISNAYKTVEFITDKECGVNGCGEKIYCLPANSHLAIEMAAANLKTCLSNADCSAFSPFTACIATALGYSTCQNPDNKNYPAANLTSLDGVVDAAINSLDGDRSTYADGPLDYYNENYQPQFNVDKKDKYKWSFYINDKIALEPPQITFINPSQGAVGVGLADPIQINFNTLMMNSTLRTGSILNNSGTSTFEHKLINVRSSSPSPLGYWLNNENQDTEPLDGAPDLTITKIFHSDFNQSLTYKPQVGSGVKDIYQNCFKPSAGPNCTATQEKPSCCFGNPTDVLGADGNCQ